MTFDHFSHDSGSGVGVSKEQIDYDAITELNQRNSPLLRLPAELRNRIYEFAFSETIVKAQLPRFMMFPVLQPPVLHSPRLQQEISLVLVCRQTHYEAFDILRETCRFDFGGHIDGWAQGSLYKSIRGLDKATSIQIGGDTVYVWCLFANSRMGETRLERVKGLLVGKFPALKHVQVGEKVPFISSVVKKTVRDAFGLPGLKVGGRRAA